jgi:uncharacterized protein YidB (DUF937 family)
MGLFDSVLGSVLNSAATPGQAGAADLGGLLGALGQSQGGGGLAALLPLAAQLLADDGPLGGVPGLIAKFHQAGLGDVLGSWLGSGPHAAITPDQITQVLGSDVVRNLAAQVGLDADVLTSQLAPLLPSLVSGLMGAQGDSVG